MSKFDSSEVGVDFDMRRTDQKRDAERQSHKVLAHPEIIGCHIIEKIQKFWKEFSTKVDKRGRF